MSLPSPPACVTGWDSATIRLPRSSPAVWLRLHDWPWPPVVARKPRPGWPASAIWCSPAPEASHRTDGRVSSPRQAACRGHPGSDDAQREERSVLDSLTNPVLTIAGMGKQFPSVLGCSIHEHSFASRCFVESDSTAAATLTATRRRQTSLARPASRLGGGLKLAFARQCVDLPQFGPLLWSLTERPL